MPPHRYLHPLKLIYIYIYMLHLYVLMGVNNGNESGSIKKIEKQSNLKVMDLL